MSSASAKGSRRYAPIGKYEILAHVATGGMGAVYRARDTQTGETVALKVLSPALAGNPALRERFRREAGHGMKFRHEHLVTIHDFNEANGIYFFALEFVDGTDLHEYIGRKGKLDPAEARAILRQAAEALDYLHRQQVIHRDVKPSNLLLAWAGGRPQVKLTDFGLALATDDADYRVTRADHTVGTVDYMAPEQARNSRLADIRSDLYSLGCTLYHMLAGRAPFVEGGMMERLMQHAETEPPDVRRFNPGVSAEFVAVLRRLLAKKPKDRYQTPAELLDDLRRLDGEDVPRPEVRHDPPAETARPSSMVFATTSEPPATGPLDSDDAIPLPGVHDEQRRAAAGQFERAKQVIAANDYNYAIHLVCSCCHLDPAKLTYRKTLRRLEKKKYRDRHGLWLAWATTFLAKARLRAAVQRRNHLKVLRHGEDVLMRNPWDVETQLSMAAAAGALNLNNLALWILLEVLQLDERDLRVNRELARLYEKRGELPKAIQHWKRVLRADPTDREAPHRMQDLAARHTLIRGNYEQTADADKDVKIRLRRA